MKATTLFIDYRKEIIFFGTAYKRYANQNLPRI